MEKLITSEISFNSSINSSNTHNYDKEDTNDFKMNRYKRVTFPNDSQIVKDSSVLNHTIENNLEVNDCLNDSFASVTTTSSIVDNKVIKRKIMR